VAGYSITQVMVWALFIALKYKTHPANDEAEAVQRQAIGEGINAGESLLPPMTLVKLFCYQRI